MTVTRRAAIVGAIAGAGAWAALGPGGVTARAAASSIAPTASLVTRWDTDRWSRGAYSALPPGVPLSVRSTLGRAVLGGRIVLAGEYCDPQFPATVPGALRSGHTAAALLDDVVGVAGRSVAVVGAGVSGLAAADALAALGATPIVWEARDRIGGRIRTDRTWGVPVEMGAAWLHGVGSNAMRPLVAQAGLTLVPTDYDDEVVRSIATGTRDPAAATVQDRLAELLTVLERSWPSVDRSVSRWLAGHGWRAGVAQSWAEQTQIAQEYGSDADVLGVRAVEEGAYLRGGDAFVAGGYDAVPRHLADGRDIRLSQPVRSVVARPGGVAVVTDAGDVAVDAAVVAVPLALLRAGLPRVSPTTAAVRSAATRLATGDLEKVVLRFARPWWREEHGDDVRVIGLVGARWSEWYDISDVTGVPSLVGFCGARAAGRRPATDAGCVREAVGELRAAYAAG